jgi:hypothetical protein
MIASHAGKCLVKRSVTAHCSSSHAGNLVSAAKVGSKLIYTFAPDHSAVDIEAHGVH